MRLLHAGSSGVRSRVHRRRACNRCRLSSRVDERKYLPMLCLSADHGCRARRYAKNGGLSMRNFDYAVASRVDDAVLADGVSTMPIAGGTELLNWFRLGIAAPDRVIDIGRIDGLSSIEIAAD